jgi:hypothetical protein
VPVSARNPEQSEALSKIAGPGKNRRFGKNRCIGRAFNAA